MSKEKLITLIQAGEIDTIKTLIDENPEYITLRFDRHELLIHYAAGCGLLILVQYLLDKKPDLINATDIHGQTPLLCAASNGHADVVEFLAGKGANLNWATQEMGKYNGYAAIDWASEHGHHKVIQCLIRHGADINARVGTMQFHPIHLAAQNGQLKVVKLLLTQNPNLLNITDTMGQTPLLWAAANGHADVVEFLAGKGANLNWATQEMGKYNGYAAIDWARERGHRKVVECLMHHGADINARVGIIQLHPIHLAAQNGQLELIQEYLEKHPELLNLQDEFGQTPLLLAASRGHIDIVEYLIKKHANLDLKNTHEKSPYKGYSALHFAIERNFHKIASILRQAGAINEPWSSENLESGTHTPKISSNKHIHWATEKASKRPTIQREQPCAKCTKIEKGNFDSPEEGVSPENNMSKK